ncbi:MAG: T9SS type A sorting domain-containing protein [Prolixibacteraceae bacterium]|nr:T9SS type A sorting domain-containing protein [Prolixibacteraceae bacterium]
MRNIKTFILLMLTISLQSVWAQTVVKMDMPPQADQPLKVVALFDEEIPEGIPVVLGLMGYDVEGGKTPYLFEWLLNGEVISTSDIAIFTPNKGDDLELKVTDNNKCRANTSFNLKVASLPGSDNNTETIKIYPTVVSNFIHLEVASNSGDKAWLRILDIQGKLIQQEYVSESRDIDVDLDPGTYFVYVKYGELNKVQKIIAQ